MHSKRSNKPTRADRRDKRAKAAKRDSSRRAEKQKTAFHVTPLQPKTQNQAHYIQSLARHPYVLASGLAGTGKTYIAARVAAQLLKQSKIDRIVLLRPAASASQSLGFFKGTHEEKMRMWLAPILGALKEEFCPSELDYMLKEGVDRLVFCPLETAKGNSWKDAFVIVDEAEDCTLKEMKTLLTRVGVNTTMAICGDITQVDIPDSGMGHLFVLREKSPKLRQVIDHIDLADYEDIVRSLAVRLVIEGFDEAA